MFRPLRKLFRRAKERPRSFRRRSLLSLEQLEDRTLLTVIGPGQTWSDAFYDDQGNYHPATVSVTDDGPGWVNVSGGGGMCSVSPAEGSDFELHIWGTGDWSGNADHLRLHVLGSMSNITVSGALDAWMTDNVGPVNAGSIGNLGAARSLGNIAAAGNITFIGIGLDTPEITAGGNIGGISAGRNLAGDVTAPGDIGSLASGADLSAHIQAGGVIGEVTVAHSMTGTITAGTNIGVVGAGANFSGPVTAGGGIDSLWAGQDFTGTIQANGAIGQLGVEGNFTSLVTAGGDINRIQVIGDFSASVSAVGSVGGVAIAGATSGTLVAGGSIGFVWATLDLNLPIQAGGNIGFVYSDASIVAPVSAGGSVGLWTSVSPGPSPFFFYPRTASGSGVEAGGDIASDITAGQDMLGALAHGNVSSNISAGRDVGGVHAVHEMSGSVTAGRDVLEVSGNNVAAVVTAGRDIGTVEALEAISGSIAAGGSVGSVHADAGTIAAPVTAQLDIGGVSSDGGDVSAPVTAGGSIGVVSAGHAITGSVTAGEDIGGVTTDFEDGGDISGAVRADHDIQAVTARGSVTSVYAGHNIDGVGAGADVGSVTAANDITSVGASGSIGQVSAGQDVGAVGSYSLGSVTAGRDITSVETLGAFSGTVAAGRDILSVTAPSLSGSISAGRSVGGVLAGDGDVTAGITAGNAIGNVGASRNVDGVITAGGYIGGVSAGSAVSGSVTAGSDIGSVGAGTSISATITAGGNLGTATAGGGSISGGITAGGSIGSVKAFGGAGQGANPVPLPGEERLTSGLSWNDPRFNGSPPLVMPADRPTLPTLAAGGNISASISAGGAISTVTAFGAITGSINSGGNIPDIWALQNVSGDVSTAGTVRARSWGNIGGALQAAGNLDAWSFGDMTGDLISSGGAIKAGSWKDLTGDLDAHGRIDAWSHDRLGMAETSIHSTDGAVSLYAGGKLTADIDASGYLAAYTADTFTGDLTSRTSDIWAQAGHIMDLNDVEAQGDVWLDEPDTTVDSIVDSVQAGSLTLWHGLWDLSGSDNVAGQTLIDGATVSFFGQWNTRDLVLRSGKIAGTGDIIVTHEFTWSGGRVAGTGALTIAMGAVLSIEDGTDKTLAGRPIYNLGEVLWKAEDSVTILGVARILNGSDASFRLYTDAGFVPLDENAKLTVDNLGLVRKEDGDGVSSFRRVELNNYGSGALEVGAGTLEFPDLKLTSLATIDIEDGTLRLADAWIMSGEVEIEGDGTLELGGPVQDDPTISFWPEASLSGDGAVVVSGTVRVDGSYDVGNTLITGGSIAFNAPASSDNTLLQNGWLGGTATYTTKQAFVWQGGAMRGSGTTRIALGAELLITGREEVSNKVIGSNRILENYGTALWGGLGGISFDGQNAAVRNYGTFEVTTDNVIASDPDKNNVFENLRPTIDQTAVFRKRDSEGTTFFDNVRFVNSGLVELKTGVLKLSGGGSDSGTIDFTNSVQLRDAQGFLQTVTLPGGTLELNGPTPTIFEFETFSRVLGEGTIRVVGGDLRVSAPITVANLELLTWGVISGSADLTIQRKFLWYAGRMEGEGVTEVSEDGLLYLSGPPGKPLDRVLNNFGRVIWGRGQEFSRLSTSETFKNSDSQASLMDVSKIDEAFAVYANAVWQAQDTLHQAEQQASDAYEGPLDNPPVTTERGMANAYAATYSDLSNDYNRALILAQGEYEQHPGPDETADDERYWDTVAQAEGRFDDGVGRAAEDYATAEQAAYGSYGRALKQAQFAYFATVSAALDQYRRVEKDIQVSWPGNRSPSQGAEQLRDLINNVSHERVNDFLATKTADWRASVAVAYRRLTGHELTDDVNWATGANFLHYGQATNPSDPPPSGVFAFLSNLNRWVRNTVNFVSQLTPANVWEGVQTVWNAAGETVQAVYRETTGFVRDVFYLLDNDPQALRQALREGLRDGAVIATNGLTLNTIPELREQARELVEQNGGLYRLANVSATVGGEAIVTVAGMGTTQLARGAAVATARSVAQRMGIRGAAETRMICGATTAARVYQPIQTIQQINALASGVAQARQAIDNGDYEGAAVGLFRTGFAATALPGSLRESARFGRALGQSFGSNPNALRDYLRACFAAGTPILGEHGEKPVEEVRTGDRVWSRNEFDPKAPLALKEIEEAFVSSAPIWHVHVGGQVIRTTAEHPFWVKGFGWVEAHLLKVGEVLLGHEGQEMPVQDILDTGEWETVYNFRVADYHTYFVGSPGWGFAVWAHNACVQPITRRDGNWNPRPAATNPQVTLYGLAQNATGTANDRHAGHIGAVVDRLARRAPAGSYIVMNRSWRTALGGDQVDSDAAFNRLRADIVYVQNLGRGRYRIHAYEIRSGDQSEQELRARLNNGWSSVVRNARIRAGRRDVLEIGQFPSLR